MGLESNGRARGVLEGIGLVYLRNLSMASRYRLLYQPDRLCLFGCGCRCYTSFIVSKTVHRLLLELIQYSYVMIIENDINNHVAGRFCAKYVSIWVTYYSSLGAPNILRILNGHTS